MTTAPKAKQRPSRARARKTAEDKPQFLKDAEAVLDQAEAPAHPNAIGYEQLIQPLLDVAAKLANANGMALYARVEPLPGGDAQAHAVTIMPKEGNVSVKQAFVAHIGNYPGTLDEGILSFITAYGHLNSPALVAAQIALTRASEAVVEGKAG